MKIWCQFLVIILWISNSSCSGSKKEACTSFITSTFYRGGYVLSPNFPLAYPPNTICRYEFRGNATERIQLTFIDFSLAGNHTECYYSDTIELFTIHRGKFKPIDLYCGSKLPAPILSNGNRMMLEFRGLYSDPNVRGFKFDYKFITNFGITTGQQQGDNCSFVYNSNETQKGYFSSPNYPGIYPINILCDYTFKGNDDQRVLLRFSYFDVEGVYPCDSDKYGSGSDSLEFSNYETRDRKFQFFCGQLEQFNVTSDGKYFRATFRSNEILEGTGFSATYEFIDPPKNKKIKFDINSKNYSQKLSFEIFCIFVNLLFLKISNF